MSKTPDIRILGKNIAKAKASIDEITMFMNSLIPEGVNQVNSLFAPRQLAKLDRATEPLPTDTTGSMK